PNSLAGENLRVLIAQVTTCGDWSLQTCIQTFVNASTTNLEQTCPDLLEAVHPYINGTCVNDSDGDGVCDEFEIAGCSEPEACNYEPNATDDSMDCDYTCYGCIDEGACNYNSIATVDDGTCDYLSCAGCMNSMACNFDVDATIEDSTCILPGDPCDDGYENSINDEIQPSCECQGIGCNDPDACNYEPNAIPNASLCNYITLFAISGEGNPTANMLFSYSYPNTSGSTYDWVSTSGDVTDGEGTSDVNVSWWGGGAGFLCVTETNSGGCSGEEVCFSVNISAVSIDELENGDFEVFPSPASTNVNIIIQNGVQSGELFIRDNSGRLVRRCSLQNETTINVSDLPRGAYLFQLNLQAEQPSYRRVILN
ncbi:MAG TPA: T9SS type A sorting domain-containing protein, partial [Flavobacteriales bacterium]|nr:T9SS type A sorting domain-containing protein [Flavobacteriales bacterium]